MKEIFKNVKEKLTSKYLENNSLKSGNILKDVKDQLTAKYLEKKSSKSIKKFKPRIKARLRKNKQIINKNIDNFFSWVKGAELVELKQCNTAEDPVRPELDVSFRTSNGRKIYGVKYKKEIHAVMCFAFTNKVPKNVEELDKFSKDAHLQSTLREDKMLVKLQLHILFGQKKKVGVN